MIFRSYFINCVFLLPKKGGQVARSAGTFCQLLSLKKEFFVVKLPSGKLRFFNKYCWATIGKVGNIDFYMINKGKAGTSRWLSNRPTVRGTAMNPVDHPHGGATGRAPRGRIPSTPWGKITSGVKTRRRKNVTNFYHIK